MHMYLDPLYHLMELRGELTDADLDEAESLINSAQCMKYAPRENNNAELGGSPFETVETE